MATETSNRPYQLVIFGASGFTGQYVVEEVARTADGEDYRGQELRWAVAGRSQKKLEKVLSWAAERLGKPQLKSIDIVICDINDAPSLADMCKKASVVLDCVGPYRFYGEAVVKACIENGAHFLDISGEPKVSFKSPCAHNGLCACCSHYSNFHVAVQINGGGRGWGSFRPADLH
ncbi:hypothetical protein GDO78_018090 [Eleutherodactylus coqui]|uniref:Saccharopine dehydrogenase-like oxidoreductase n=1 Tax=Eleutherodactylus coqui TaxID=57060 RepID=A0A8J6C7E6_ELECQ|nr:hypothetical protein GDO78_018090 [Eleutherodactylus coqui]